MNFLGMNNFKNIDSFSAIYKNCVFYVFFFMRLCANNDNIIIC